ncbi:uncharacterized protein LOC113147354 [Cyclospora cayetanensis]|uniref:Uncharacterized protein LOC113147354 n=1 Tax=Cyclospora cayetanensis TaxID=88456 RepID=A0A6P6S2A0_9EIME|nr:uncharacterized protein LOC113147354 [Cyclospora cayetanensis]
MSRCCFFYWSTLEALSTGAAGGDTSSLKSADPMDAQIPETPAAAIAPADEHRDELIQSVPPTPHAPEKDLHLRGLLSPAALVSSLAPATATRAASVKPAEDCACMALVLQNVQLLQSLESGEYLHFACRVSTTTRIVSGVIKISPAMYGSSGSNEAAVLGTALEPFWVAQPAATAAAAAAADTVGTPPALLLLRSGLPRRLTVEAWLGSQCMAQGAVAAGTRCLAICHITVPEAITLQSLRQPQQGLLVLSDAENAEQEDDSKESPPQPLRQPRPSTPPKHLAAAARSAATSTTAVTAAAAAAAADATLAAAHRSLLRLDVSGSRLASSLLEEQQRQQQQQQLQQQHLQQPLTSKSNSCSELPRKATDFSIPVSTLRFRLAWIGLSLSESQSLVHALVEMQRKFELEIRKLPSDPGVWEGKSAAATDVLTPLGCASTRCPSAHNQEEGAAAAAAAAAAAPAWSDVSSPPSALQLPASRRKATECLAALQPELRQQQQRDLGEEEAHVSVQLVREFIDRRRAEAEAVVGELLLQQHEFSQPAASAVENATGADTAGAVARRLQQLLFSLRTHALSASSHSSGSRCSRFRMTAKDVSHVLLRAGVCLAADSLQMQQLLLLLDEAGEGFVDLQLLLLLLSRRSAREESALLAAATALSSCCCVLAAEPIGSGRLHTELMQAAAVGVAATAPLAAAAEQGGSSKKEIVLSAHLLQQILERLLHEASRRQQQQQTAAAAALAAPSLTSAHLRLACLLLSLQSLPRDGSEAAHADRTLVLEQLVAAATAAEASEETVLTGDAATVVEPLKTRGTGYPALVRCSLLLSHVQAAAATAAASAAASAAAQDACGRPCGKAEEALEGTVAVPSISAAAAALEAEHGTCAYSPSLSETIAAARAKQAADMLREAADALLLMHWKLQSQRLRDPHAACSAGSAERQQEQLKQLPPACQSLLRSLYIRLLLGCIGCSDVASVLQQFLNVEPQSPSRGGARRKAPELPLQLQLQGVESATSPAGVWAALGVLGPPAAAAEALQWLVSCIPRLSNSDNNSNNNGNNSSTSSSGLLNDRNNNSSNSSALLEAAHAAFSALHLQRQQLLPWLAVPCGVAAAEAEVYGAAAAAGVDLAGEMSLETLGESVSAERCCLLLQQQLPVAAADARLVMWGALPWVSGGPPPARYPKTSVRLEQLQQRAAAVQANLLQQTRGGHAALAAAAAAVPHANRVSPGVLSSIQGDAYSWVAAVQQQQKQMPSLFHVELEPWLVRRQVLQAEDWQCVQVAALSLPPFVLFAALLAASKAWRSSSEETFTHPDPMHALELTTKETAAGIEAVLGLPNYLCVLVTALLDIRGEGFIRYTDFRRLPPYLHAATREAAARAARAGGGKSGSAPWCLEALLQGTQQAASAAAAAADLRDDVVQLLTAGPKGGVLERILHAEGLVSGMMTPLAGAETLRVCKRRL